MGLIGFQTVCKSYQQMTLVGKELKVLHKCPTGDKSINTPCFFTGLDKQIFSALN